MNTSNQDTALPAATSLPELAAGVVGAALIGSASNDGRGRLARIAGLALVGLAARRVLEEMLRDIGDRRRQVVMRSSIDIDRGVGEVFAFLNDFENFPRVIGNLRSVVDFQDGRAHWEAYTPTGHLVTWDTVITKYVPRSVIAWESTAGSEVRMKSLVRFTVLSPTRTHVDLETTYCPPHTGVQDAIRSLFGPAQEKRLQDDLEHARSYIESLAPREAAGDEHSSERASSEAPASVGSEASHDPTADEGSRH